MTSNVRKLLKLKKADTVLIAILVLISFLPVIFFSAAPVSHAILKIDGTQQKEFDLAIDQSYRYQAPDGDTNLIEVKNEQIRIKSASCPDQRCVQQGWISEHGETIVCLPHKLVIEIVGGDK